MKKYIIAFVLVLTTIVAHAQTEISTNDMQEDLQQVLKPTYGDYYEGLS